MNIILIILVILLLCGGLGNGLYRGWGGWNGGGISLGAVLVILLVLYLLGVI